MARLKCFSIDGLELWFWPKDHEPPHFHAKRAGDWEIRIYFLENSAIKMFEVKWADRQPSKGDRRLLEECVVQHRAEILQEWEQKVKVDEN